MDVTKKGDPLSAATGAGQGKVDSLSDNSIDSRKPINARLLDAKQAAIYLGIGARLLWSLTNCGDIASIRIGSRAVRYDVRDLDLYITRHRKGGQRK